MGFTLIWPVALTLLAGGIVIMYLLKQHAEEYQVPSLFLWAEMYKNQTADKPWEKLKKNILMVLEIMTLIILVIALMGPYIKVGKGSGSTVMVVIDNSASMQCIYSGSDTRLDSAKSDAEKLIKNLPSDTMVAVIASNSESNVLLSATRDRTAAIAAVKGITQTERSGSCESGVKTARALYNAYEDAAIVLFTDTYVSTGSLNASIYDYSGKIENAGVSYAFVEDNGDDTYTVAAGVTNYGSSSITTSVDLMEISENGERMVASQSVTVPAGEVTRIEFDDVTLTAPGLAIELGSDDDLMADNTYYIPRNNKKDAEILLFSKDGNTFLEKAVKLVDGVNLDTNNASQGFTGITGYQLYIFDCLGDLDLSDLPEDGNILIIGCATGSETDTKKQITLTGKNSYGTYSVPVNQTYIYTLPGEAESLFDTEDGASAGYLGELNGRKICMIGFDLHSTDFPLTVNFPIFMYELITELTDTSPVSATNIYPGDEVNISLHNMTESSVKDPDGKETKVDSIDRYTDTEKLGCYFVKGDTDDTVFTVNFDAAESNVQEMQTDADSNVEIKTGGGTGTLNLRTLIIAIALLLLAVEWIIYIRQ